MLLGPVLSEHHGVVTYEKLTDLVASYSLHLLSSHKYTSYDKHQLTEEPVMFFKVQAPCFIWKWKTRWEGLIGLFASSVSDEKSFIASRHLAGLKTENLSSKCDGVINMQEMYWAVEPDGRRFVGSQSAAHVIKLSTSLMVGQNKLVFIMGTLTEVEGSV